MAMKDTLVITKQRKINVITSLLNLYLFGEIETSEFKLINIKLQKEVTSHFALHFLKEGFQRNDEKVLDFCKLIYQKFPENIKWDLYTMLLVNSRYDFYRNLALLDVLMNSSIEAPIDLWKVDAKNNLDIENQFIKNNGVSPIMNEFLIFLFNFNDKLIIDKNGCIAKTNYRNIIRQKLMEIEAQEEKFPF